MQGISLCSVNMEMVCGSCKNGGLNQDRTFFLKGSQNHEKSLQLAESKYVKMTKLIKLYFSNTCKTQALRYREHIGICHRWRMVGGQNV